MIADKVIGRAAYIPGATDTHGNEIDDWADPVDINVYGWGPRMDSTEPGGSQVIVGLEVYAPVAVTIGSLDRVVVGGAWYTVEGEPGDWSNGPLARDVGEKVINLKRVEGGR